MEAEADSCIYHILSLLLLGILPVLTFALEIVLTICNQDRKKINVFSFIVGYILYQI